MTKREGLIEMLKRFKEAQETLLGPTDFRQGEPDGVTLMPLSWNRSFRELDRCLRRLRDRKPTLYRHLRERYIDPEIVTVDLLVKNGKVIYPACCEHDAGQPQIGSKMARVRVRRWRTTLNDALVKEGIDWLMVEFNETPSLPGEMVA